mmetsp:Transcript_63213/g.186845  ORF Transcript_63213/g.186845 Transcript_63213/m.186845 type:complete len:99 (+) Transcript_63213:93-389(+)
MSVAKTPVAVSDAIKKLDASDQVAVQTYIAQLKSTIEDLEGEVLKLKKGDAHEDDAHAHFHGHEKCTADHGHSDDAHHGDEEVSHDHGHKHEGHSHGE